MKLYLNKARQGNGLALAIEQGQRYKRLEATSPEELWALLQALLAEPPVQTQEPKHWALGGGTITRLPAKGKPRAPAKPQAGLMALPDLSLEALGL